MINETKIIRESFLDFIEKNQKLGGYVKANDLMSFVDTPMVHELFLKILEDNGWRFFIDQVEHDYAVYCVGKKEWTNEEIKAGGLCVGTLNSGFDFYNRLLDLVKTATFE